MENTKQNKLLYIITKLLAINLLGTLWLVKQVAFQPTKLASKNTDQENLPDYLTKKVRKEIFKEFQEAFNSQDDASFWNLFSDLAKSQINEEEVKKSYDSLRGMFGKVSNGVFTYYEFVGKQGSLKTFNLHYNIAFESKYGNKGNVQITITDDGKEYGVVGVNMMAQ